MAVKLIIDPLFKVSIDPNSRQQDPSMSIWNAMHRCVSPRTELVTTFKHGFDPVRSVIDNALKFGHWDVLHHASIKLNFDGFPHSTAMQFRTHRQMSVLVQSLRYSDEQFSACADGDVDPMDIFYFRPIADKRKEVLNYGRARRSCRDYANAIENGEDKETARDNLLCNYRQGFTMSGTFCQWMHVLDRRLLADTQLESRTAATMALDQLRGYSGFFEWYASSRAGKNLLSP
jgi:flavin-dependent thymidylate synthase